MKASKSPILTSHRPERGGPRPPVEPLRDMAQPRSAAFTKLPKASRRRRVTRRYPVRLTSAEQAAILSLPALRDAISTALLRARVAIALRLMSVGMSMNVAAAAVGMAISNLSIRLKALRERGPDALVVKARTYRKSPPMVLQFVLSMPPTADDDFQSLKRGIVRS